jgi:hypothetical protein
MLTTAFDDGADGLSNYITLVIKIHRHILILPLSLSSCRFQPTYKAMVPDRTQSCTDFGYGDTAPHSAPHCVSRCYGYGEVENSGPTLPENSSHRSVTGGRNDQDLGYGMASPDSTETRDYGHGNMMERAPGTRARRRGSVTKYSLDAAYQARVQHESRMMCDLENNLCHQNLPRADSTASGDYENDGSNLYCSRNGEAKELVRTEVTRLAHQRSTFP